MKFRFNYKLISISFLFLPLTLLQAQFTNKDSSLIRTTFKRDFEKSIVYDYLNSPDSQKVNAALLSVSHSNDTSFVDTIIGLNFDRYGELVAFSLGQIGESKSSTKFLMDKLVLDDNLFQEECFKAIGFTGDSLTLDNLFTMIQNDSIKNKESFPYTLTNFYSRGIHNQSTIPYLIKNISYKESTEEELFTNLYSLYRTGPDSTSKKALESILINSKDEKIISYALNNFRKLEYFLNDFNLAQELLLSESWNIKTEALSAICYYPFNSIEELKIYFALLEDMNPNVARTAGSSISNINYSKLHKDDVSKLIEYYLSSPSLTDNSRGELFVSYCSLFPEDLEDKIEEYENEIRPKFIYRVLKDNIKDSDFNFDFLSDRIAESNEVELLDLLPAFLAIQNRYLNEDEYAAIVLKVLNGEKSSSVSVIAYGLKAPFIYHYQEMLQEIIIDQIFKFRNKPFYTDAIISLADLAARINPSFYTTVLDLINQSQLNSHRRFAAEELNVPIPPKIISDRTNLLIRNSFKYKSALIETNKGTFTIDLKPEIAPISVGNFISLAEEGFYNEIPFHRVVPDFVIQSGDSTGTGWSGPGYQIVSEFSTRSFEKGSVGMASTGKDTEGSQWFVMHSIYPHLDNKYTNFGDVIDGLNTVNIIDECDRIIQIKLIK